MVHTIPRSQFGSSSSSFPSAPVLNILLVIRLLSIRMTCPAHFSVLLLYDTFQYKPPIYANPIFLPSFRSKIIHALTTLPYAGVLQAPHISSSSILSAYCLLTASRVSSGSIVSDYELDDRAIGVRSPVGAKGFFL
jgi:hypothetical protein